MEREVDVWNQEKEEFEVATVKDRNGSLTYVEYDNGNTDWICGFEFENRDW